MSAYEYRCLRCGDTAPSETLAEAEAVMALHQATNHPDSDRKIIRPRAAALQLAIERGQS